MTRSTRQAAGAALLYAMAACALTWPLLTVINHEIAADMGDPVFVCWVLLWTSGQIFAFLSGDAGALSRYWHGNIFYPEPMTLAYSEHLTAQMVQALPFLAVTDNIVLVYNLLYLSTYVLCGLGMFLFVRDLTGKPLPAFIAGLAFAFAPYRTDQFSHLQVLSAQWMPFALWGFRRYLDTGRKLALAGGSVALVAQNLSNGYYLLFFPPFAAAYVVYELAARQRLRDWVAWRAFAIAGLLVALATLPFLLPYFEVRDSGVGVRAIAEISAFSADAHAFATASDWSWLWGNRINAYPRPEGQAFPGLAILALAIVAIVAGIGQWDKHGATRSSASRQVMTGMVAVVLAGHLYATGSLLMTGGFTLPFDGTAMVWHNGGRVMLTTLGLAIALVVLVRRRAGPGGERPLPWFFFAAAAAAAAFLAMGPEILVRGGLVSRGPYAWLMDVVPGFDGLRVPARFVGVMTMFTAVLAGIGAAEVARRFRAGATIVICAGLLMWLEAWPAGFPTNVRLAAGQHDVTARELRTGDNISTAYKAIRDSERPMVLLEFPFGVPAWDLHTVFYAGFHRQRVVNGYSGFFPESHLHLLRLFNLRRTDPEAAWRALLGSGATHVLVHEAAYPERRRREISDWLIASGAREVLVDGTDRLFSVR